jgi:hypothetical protein
MVIKINNICYKTKMWLKMGFAKSICTRNVIKDKPVIFPMIFLELEYVNIS